MMRRAIALLTLLAAASCASARPRALDPARFAAIDATINDAIAAHKLPGGVYHLERNGEVYEKAYGNRALVPRVEATTVDTIYDAASLTKVIATAPSIWLLVQRGKIDIDAPVTRYIPEYPRPDITVRHLMTHTSGLRPDVDLDTPWSGHAEGIRRAIADVPRNRPGIFRYSDINYILLGEIVERVSGQPLNVFAETEIFATLGMRDTRFLPPPSDRIAPTEFADGVMLRGVVHDPTSRRMGGVAGHAGLFTTAHDIAIFARTLLAGGGGVWSPEIVKRMTTVQSPPAVAVRRGAGFDIDSSFSRPRGDVFPIGSYGHTGFTGTILWIDPYSKTFYTFTGNRVHPDGHGSITALQRALGTASARAVRDFDFTNVPDALPKRPGGEVGWIIGGADALNAIDSLSNKAFAARQDLRLGLITNHTGIDRSGNPTADILRSTPGVNLVALFSPEHGIRGVADANVADAKDPASGLPVFSLYGETRKPTAEQLANVDALVFDVQDIGARFYTYISTLGLAMEAAAESHKKFIVLDRVNPIGGDLVEGPLLHDEPSFIAFHDIPVRHGMTVGELARMYRAERHLDLDLTVVPVQKWTRSMWQDEAGLPWINTSPNMRSLNEAALYPGIGILESAVSVGRGTPTPFELVGAPYVDGAALARAIGPIAGVRITPTTFTPDASVFKGERCGGIRLEITDRHALRAVTLGIAIARALQQLYEAQFALDKLEPLLRDPRTIAAIREQKPLDEIVALWDADVAKFRERRAQYLLYP